MITKVQTMNECISCAKLRHKLSPLEDPDFTADFLLVQPLDWMIEQQSARKGSAVRLVNISAAECFEKAFGHTPNLAESMQMGRTLKALGWEQTKQNGHTRYVMELWEFENEYRTQ